ncbi:uncharacterized protein LOC106159430 [Lingula anatina]|uniref:Uncharacterized protein LOC106159430 n=1 Tax=Lingula anatina TaxID=7574 RepID=A0A1S3HYS2_LINAN|nr:uncharacterized protein LOC106159430 [Lingula anatina]|eukprot:XP_013391172.1 uncharacterized protein LOC106159430 [Lingula anatina]
MNYDGVRNFLRSLDLSQYFEMFKTKGYERESDLVDLDEKDLDDLLITDPEHRRLVLVASQGLEISPEGALLDFLVANGLEHYYENFLHEHRDMDMIENIDTTQARSFQELEITLPGHRKRLHRAVTQLRKRRKLSAEAEDPVATGYWGKPRPLADAKNDFLCIHAAIKGVGDADYEQMLEFMVDSGSDVVTVEESTLSRLRLEHLGTVKSHGVHATKEKQIYRAMLRIGREEIEIEVMGETYNSLGSQVIRHFRHYINGNRHIWLKGTRDDPIAAKPPPLLSSSSSTSSTSPSSSPPAGVTSPSSTLTSPSKST